MRIEYLYRYPVKGLTAEALEETDVETGGCIPWDRAFALAQGDARFEPEHPRYLPKQNFLCLMVNTRAAQLRSNFDPRTGLLSIRGRATSRSPPMRWRQMDAPRSARS